MSRKSLFLAALLLLIMIPQARAESGQTLIENSVSFDGKMVTFNGEVIGVLTRGDHAWVNVLEKEFAIGVWCSSEAAKKISVIGDYRHVGDIVEVTGIFHMACTEHGGDLDIHAEYFVVVAEGNELDRPVSLPLAVISVALVAVAICVAYYLRRVRKEREKTMPWPTY